MRVFFDTEFIDDGKTIDLISIGMVREDGLVYEAQSSECNLSNASPWVVENVLPHLGDLDPRTRATIAQDILGFVGESPTFWAYIAAYDWVALCQLYGPMIDLPSGWPWYCRDMKQVMDMFGMKKSQFPNHDGRKHNALDDALWLKDAYAFLIGTRRNIGREEVGA